jgi:hypothetical protein
MKKVPSGPEFRPGDTVKLITKDPVVVHFGRGVEPTKLQIGKVYSITAVEVHSMHTLIWVDGGMGTEEGPFNSALFEWAGTRTVRNYYSDLDR